MTHALEIRNLVKTFGGLVATDDLSFDIKTGQSVGLIGPNGAGKTTVFSQIMGELRQTSGKISLFGETLGTLPTAERIGAVSVRPTKSPALSLNCRCWKTSAWVLCIIQYGQ